MEQRSTFDKVADLYDRARPGYPDALVDDVVTAARLAPGDAILEVGCGTGQATTGFARRGFRILALDPGPELVRVARQHFAGFRDIEFMTTTFEAWPPQPAAFRLLVAAQSWHWIARDVAFAKAAEVLEPGGTLAVFGNVPVGLEPPLRDDFVRIYRHHFGVSGPPPEAWYLPSGPLIGMFDESRRFAPVVHRSYPWSWKHTATSFIDFSRTRSDHQLLPPQQREALLAALAEAIAAQGGEFELRYEAHLYLARRKD